MHDRSTTVFIVDDDPSVRTSLSRLLRSAGFDPQSFASAEEFLNAVGPSERGCVLVDVSMPGLDGLQLQQRLTEQGCGWPLVFITGSTDVRISVNAMRAGALNYLTKPHSDAALLAAIDEALERERVGYAERLASDTARESLARLTPREREVLTHVVAGKRNKQIAAELGTVEKTIKVHRARVMRKMRAHSIADLVRMAEQLGVVQSRNP